MEFSKKKSPYNVKNEEIFFNLVRSAFSQKRKTLRNNLKSFDLEKIENVLTRHSFSLMTRAEELSIDIFVEIANELS